MASPRTVSAQFSMTFRQIKQTFILSISLFGYPDNSFLHRCETILWLVIQSIINCQSVGLLVELSELSWLSIAGPPAEGEGLLILLVMLQI